MDRSRQKKDYHQFGVVLPLWHFTLLQVIAPVPLPTPPVENVNGVVPHWLS